MLPAKKSGQKLCAWVPCATALFVVRAGRVGVGAATAEVYQNSHTHLVLSSFAGGKGEEGHMKSMRMEESSCGEFVWVFCCCHGGGEACTCDGAFPWREG